MSSNGVRIRTLWRAFEETEPSYVCVLFESPDKKQPSPSNLRPGDKNHTLLFTSYGSVGASLGLLSPSSEFFSHYFLFLSKESGGRCESLILYGNTKDGTCGRVLLTPCHVSCLSILVRYMFQKLSQ